MKPMLLAIAKHEFNTGQLFKVDPQLKGKPWDSHFQLSEAGVLIKAEMDASPKEYPSFQSLHNPLHIYFNVLIHQLIASGNQKDLSTACTVLICTCQIHVQILGIPLQVPQLLHGGDAGRFLQRLGAHGC